MFNAYLLVSFRLAPFHSTVTINIDFFFFFFVLLSILSGVFFAARYCHCLAQIVHSKHMIHHHHFGSMPFIDDFLEGGKKFIFTIPMLWRIWIFISVVDLSFSFHPMCTTYQHLFISLWYREWRERERKKAIRFDEMKFGKGEKTHCFL